MMLQYDNILLQIYSEKKTQLFYYNELYFEIHPNFVTILPLFQKHLCPSHHNKLGLHNIKKYYLSSETYVTR